MKKILIITGGGTNHLRAFSKEAKSLKVDVTIASFNDLVFLSKGNINEATVKGIKLQSFKLIYIRLVGKHFEKLAILVKFAYDLGIQIIDRIYEKREFIKLPLPKSLEVKTLVDHKVTTPETFFGSLEEIRKTAPKIFGYPFVIKGTTGKQGNAVWSPRNAKELDKTIKIIENKKLDMNFLAQPFINASQRMRVFVVGGKAIAAITRPTRWRRRFLQKVNNSFPEGVRSKVEPIPFEETELALKATKALGIDVAGVDLVRDDFTKKLYVLEVNSAPRWESIRADTKINPEKEILKFLTQSM